MPAVPDWSPPNQFDLTSPHGNLVFNVPTTVGGMPCLFVLNMEACKFRIGVRDTSQNVPQSDGGILHSRFLTKTEIDLSISLWEDDDNAACDELLALMVDALSGAFRSLLNAGDNAGRLAWEVAGGSSPTSTLRMLDDCRLLVYPDYDEADVAHKTITATIDSAFPYAQDLTPIFTSIAAGDTEVLANTGTAAYFPVIRVAGPAAGFSITIGTQSMTFVNAIGGGDFVEVNTFNNTIFLNGDEDDELNGLDVLNSVFPVLEPGSNTVQMFDADAVIEWAPAYG
jgi:hypothetical protein